MSNFMEFHADEGEDGPPVAGLPPAFQEALVAGHHKGCVCAVSRVAQDRQGVVTHVEWGVTTPWLDDWRAGPQVAPAAEVVHALREGTEVLTLFPTATGFACGPPLILSDAGLLAMTPGGPAEWTLDMLARLNLSKRLH